MRDIAEAERSTLSSDLTTNEGVDVEQDEVVPKEGAMLDEERDWDAVERPGGNNVSDTKEKQERRADIRGEANGGSSSSSRAEPSRAASGMVGKEVGEEEGVVLRWRGWAAAWAARAAAMDMARGSDVKIGVGSEASGVKYLTLRSGSAFDINLDFPRTTA